MTHKGVVGHLIRRARSNGVGVAGVIPAPRGPVIDEEERAAIYGAVPPLQRRGELSVEELATLVPRILELRAQKLTWPKVAAELGIKTSQAENALKRWRQQQKEEAA